MTDKIEKIKGKLSDFKKMVQDLNIEITDYKFNVSGSDEGATIEISIKLLVPKQK